MGDGQLTGEASDSLLQRGVKNAIANPRVVYRLLLYIGIIGVVLPFLFPLYWLLLLALTPPDATFGLFTTNVTPLNFMVVLDPAGFEPLYLYIFNSITLALMTTVLVLLVGSLAGYAFGRLTFPGRWPLMLLTLSIAYFPPVSFLAPLFQLFNGNSGARGVQFADSYNTAGAIVLPLSAFTMPLAIFILTTFYSQIPDELEDAARVEGSTRIGALFRIIIPLSGPGLATAGTITFLQVYNEYLFSFLMNNGRPENWGTIVFMINNMRGASASFGAAASVAALLPVALIVFLANERIVEGLTAKRTVNE